MASVRRIRTAGGRYFEYVSQGQGPATLLVHPGGPGLTYHYLRALLKLANAHLRVVLFNPRGVGHSWKPKSPSEYPSRWSSLMWSARRMPSTSSAICGIV